MPTKEQCAEERLARARRRDEEIRRLDRRRSADMARLVYELAALAGERGFADLGFSSVARYARDRLSWGKKKVEAVLGLVERLETMPLLRERFRAGKVRWTKAVLAARAIARAPEEEARWAEDAETLDSRVLEDRVAGRTGEEVLASWRLRLSREQEAVLGEGLCALRSEGLDLKVEAALAELVIRALQGGGVGSTRSRTLLVHCSGCQETWLPTSEGEVRLSPGLAGRLHCGAELQDTRPGAPAGKVTRVPPPRVHAALVARARGGCEVPACTNRGHLHVHHLDGWRAGHDLERLLLVCTQHHAAVHDDRIRLDRSPDGVVRLFLADGTRPGVLAPSREAPSPGPSAIDLATAALRRLEVPAREAKLLIARALACEPGLRDADPGELVAAALRHRPAAGAAA